MTTDFHQSDAERRADARLIATQVSWAEAKTPWLEAQLRIVMPMAIVTRTGLTSEAMLVRLARIIDSCERPNIPARMAISLCHCGRTTPSEIVAYLDPAAQEQTALALAARYGITAEEIKQDQQPPAAQPADHWMHNQIAHIRAKPVADA